MPDTPLDDLVIRDAAVRRRDLGFILAGDLEKEKAGVEHTIAFRWKAGEFHRGEAKFTAHACCIIEEPEYGVVKLAGSGIYSVETRGGVTTGNVFNDSSPAPREPRFGELRGLATIEGKAHTSGLGGIVYRLDRIGEWSRIDESLPSEVDFEAIDGFDGREVYAAGQGGELWQYDGERWVKRELPTNEYINALACGDDGQVYAGGRNGALLRGRADAWEVVEHDSEEDIWAIASFENVIYVATMGGLYGLAGESLGRIEFGEDAPSTTYHLSVAEDVMWSIGERDIMSFDGNAWSRVV